MKNGIVFKILLGVFIILIALAVADYFTPDELWITEYVRGSFTETLGIVITLIFVERIISAQQKNDEENVEVKQLKRLDKILTTEFKKSIQYSSYMTQRPSPKDISGYIVSKDFEFNRLENFNMPSLSFFDGAKSYLLLKNAIENLLTTIREALLNYDFKFFLEIEKLLLEYIEFISGGLPFGVLEQLEYNPDLQKMMQGMIKKIPVGKIPTYEEYPQNMMISFIRLYHVINFHIDFFERYKRAILDIKEKIHE